MTDNNQRQLGRAKNALLSFFERKLSVPKIYIDREWAGTRVDILAIDRDGVGDVNVALLYPRPTFADQNVNLATETAEIDALIERFKLIPAQFKYIAGVDMGSGGPIIPFALFADLLEKSFSPDGMGRISFLTISPLGEEMKVNAAFPAERFRAFIGKLAGEYVQHNTPDWEIRD